MLISDKLEKVCQQKAHKYAMRISQGVCKIFEMESFDIWLALYFHNFFLARFVVFRPMFHQLQGVNPNGWLQVRDITDAFLEIFWEKFSTF